MIGEAACEGILIASTRSSTARMARTFSYRALRTDGVFRKILMPSEVKTERTQDRGEKTSEVSLMRW